MNCYKSQSGGKGNMKKHLIILGIITILFSIGLSGCINNENTESEKKTYNVEYRVNGTSSWVSVTYRAYGTNLQVPGVNLPWTIDIDGESGDFVIVSGSNMKSEGTVTVEIYVDGKLFDHDTDSARAEASGTLP